MNVDQSTSSDPVGEGRGRGTELRALRAEWQAVHGEVATVIEAMLGRVFAVASREAIEVLARLEREGGDLIADLETRRTSALAEMGELTARLEHLERRVGLAEEERRQAVEAAERAGADLLARAREQAEVILSEAETRAADRLAEADSEVACRIAEARARAEDLVGRARRSAEEPARDVASRPVEPPDATPATEATVVEDQLRGLAARISRLLQTSSEVTTPEGGSRPRASAPVPLAGAAVRADTSPATRLADASESDASESEVGEAEGRDAVTWQPDAREPEAPRAATWHPDARDSEAREPDPRDAHPTHAETSWPEPWANQPLAGASPAAAPVPLSDWNLPVGSDAPEMIAPADLVAEPPGDRDGVAPLWPRPLADADDDDAGESDEPGADAPAPLAASENWAASARWGTADDDPVPPPASEQWRATDPEPTATVAAGWGAAVEPDPWAAPPAAPDRDRAGNRDDRATDEEAEPAAPPAAESWSGFGPNREPEPDGASVPAWSNGVVEPGAPARAEEDGGSVPAAGGWGAEAEEAGPVQTLVFQAVPNFQAALGLERALKGLSGVHEVRVADFDERQLTFQVTHDLGSGLARNILALRSHELDLVESGRDRAEFMFRA